MLNLKETNQHIHDQFVQGNFVLHESNRKFSGVALDQAHEHNNCLVKSDGGAIGITEKEAALLRWMNSGPAILQPLQTFESSVRDQTQKSPHHDDTPSKQKKFLEDAKDMTKTIEDFGNPFLEESKELVSLDSNMVSDKTNLYEFETKGETQFEEFRNKVNTEQFYSPITKNNYEIFKNGSKLKKKNTSQNKVTTKLCPFFEPFYNAPNSAA